jgi:hypothetical protein
MRHAGVRWTLSSILRAGSGVPLIGVGIYFLFARSSLLAEDIRFMKLTLAELQLIGDRLGSWLVQAFRVMGGYVAATGVLAIALAATSFRDHHPLAAAGSMVAGAVSIGWKTAVNFVIESDFKWVLLGMALVWAFSLAAVAWEARS